MHYGKVSRDRSPMMAGGVLVALGVVIGTWIAGMWAGPAALAAGGPVSSNCLPAIAIGQTDRVLLRDQGGLYFLMDVNGSIIPLRVDDSDLKNLAGRSLLRAP